MGENLDSIFVLCWFRKSYPSVRSGIDSESYVYQNLQSSFWICMGLSTLQDMIQCANQLLRIHAVTVDISYRSRETPEFMIVNRVASIIDSEI